jgi:predicted AlkP superfamily pyrophosphatase or phosphodiesterase
MTVPDICKPKAVEVTLANGHTIGTHRFARASGNKAAFFTASPEGDAATLALAATLIQQLQLGRGPAADLVAISLSATDFVGHRYGSGGVEMCLQLTTLDAGLAGFFDVLDKTSNDYAVVLTADHGGLDVPERLRLKGIAEAARVDASATPAGIGKEIASRLSLAEPVFTGGWYLTPSVPQARRAEVLALARKLLSAHPQVHGVYAAAAVAAHPMPEGSPSDWSILDRLRASYHPDRSGDLLVVLKPQIRPAGSPSEVGTHGSLWDYDRKVPILFWWKGITPEERREDAMTVDIMPTLASLLGLPVLAEEIDGRCLDILTGPQTNCRR